MKEELNQRDNLIERVSGTEVTSVLCDDPAFSC